MALVFVIATTSGALAQTLSSTAEPVPAAPIKDIIIYQLGGWSGLAGPHKTLPEADPEWPAYGGRNAYLSRSPDILAHQMSLIAGLGRQVAIGVLLMTDSDSVKSGYGTCWNGSWSSNLPGGGGDSGTLTYPFAMYDRVRSAAHAAGVRYAPDFSLMNYDGVRGAAVLPKLKQAIAWWRIRLPDSFAARAPDGRYYVIVDSLPTLDGLSAANKAELIAYMKSQSDIDWIDNMVNDDNHPSSYTSSDNIYRSAAADAGPQSSLASREGSHYLWWFVPHKVERTYSEAHLATNETPEAIQLQFLNISPHNLNKYPVMISQWNEYAEYLIFEPSTKSGTSNYDYLKSLLSQQP